MNIEYKEPKEGMRLQVISGIFMVFSTLLIIITAVVMFSINKKYTDMTAAYDNYNVAKDAIHSLSDTSNYLTNKARQFVITHNINELVEYCEEVQVTRRREAALELVRAYSIKEENEAYNSLDEAMQYSLKLQEIEIHAMKLCAVAYGMKDSEIPQLVNDYELEKFELKLSKEEMNSLAMLLLYDENYNSISDKIDKYISDAGEMILSDRRDRQYQSLVMYKNAQINLYITITLLFGLIIILILMIRILILKPVTRFIKSVTDGVRMEEIGFFEFKYLAKAYNHMFNIQELNTEELKREAERDGLTELLNRGAFEKIKNSLSVTRASIAFLLIDVDCFKGINDNYGHEMGDKILRKVASEIKLHFRNVDYCFRVGGDEFAVIIMDMPREGKDTIIKKVESINKHMFNPEDELVRVSLSIGAAFGEGYSDELYGNADKALYVSKGRGRNGITFYEDINNN